MSFTFPTDSNGKAGAVRPTADEKNFFVPVVIYGADGVTPKDTIKTIIMDMPYERFIPGQSSNKSVTTTSQTVNVTGAIGYRVQSDPSNTQNIHILIGGQIIMKLIPGQVDTIGLASFDVVSLSGTQTLYINPIERVMPS
ncbi:hypothetical protein [Paenibacillus hamazuiensis]|uniref:hypothetical protein n=1 Tax=Paenibacillus hamazuiensis TaxID=2936508 RepID=UPI00200EBE8B|nr:hypothetical protein [Paenibacillus hamazuiensis]